jgi:hypothetical protein
MVVRGAGCGAVDVRGLHVPLGVVVVDDAGVVALVAGAGARALVERDGGEILLLDEVHGVGVDGESALAPGDAGLVCSSHCGVEGGEVAHHALVLVLLVCMDGLGVLAQVVEARELFTAVAGEWTFACVFSVCVCVSWGGLRGRGGLYLMCLARCSLLLKTMRHSP